MTDNKKIMNDEKLEQVAGGGRINPRPNPFRDYGDHTVENEMEFKDTILNVENEMEFKDTILKYYKDHKNSTLFQDNRLRIDLDESFIANKEK